VRGFGGGKIVQKLTDAGVLRARGSLLIKTPRLGFHRAHLLANLIQP
jgi:hypothetical protein